MSEQSSKLGHKINQCNANQVCSYDTDMCSSLGTILIFDSFTQLFMVFFLLTMS